MRAGVLLAVVLAGAVSAGEERAMPAAAELTSRLAVVKDRGTLRITTRGRKTGRPHTVPIWFAVEDTTLWLGTLDPRRDWVRNVGKTPEVTLDLGDLRLRGRAHAVTDPATDAHVRELLAHKYWMAWIGSWFGKGPARTFRVDGLEVA